MTFEEELSQAFATLTDRVRAEVARVRDEADREARRDSADLVEAARLVARDEAFAAGRDEGLAAGREEGLVAGRDQGLVAGRDQGLVAGREEGRREAEAAIPPPADAPAPIVDVAGGGRLIDATRAIERARSLTEVLDTLVDRANAEAAHATVWLIRGGQPHQWRALGLEDAASEPAAVVGEAARTNTVTAGDGSIAVPMAMAGTVVAVLLADLHDAGTPNPEPRTPNPEPRTSNDERRTTNLELLTLYAARSLEALTAFHAARALTQRTSEPGVASRAAAGDEANAEEDASARRYARLLVSEIKLYHEAAVIEGRRDRDLATRLGGEIAHARVMYEERVPHVPRRADHFNEELVRTLADGDASLLELKS